MSQFKYEQIKEEILSKSAQTGSLRIPSERELCRLYGVSRRTARRALQLLEDEDVITRTVGRGTFIDPAKREVKLHLIVPAGRTEVMEFLEAEIKHFTKAHGRTSVELVGTRDVMPFIKQASGAKVILAPNFGYLVHHGLMMPLDRMPGFEKTSEQLHDRHIEWHSQLNRPPSCYSLPTWSGVTMMAFNRKHAVELGLSEDGPVCWDELLEWNRRASKSLSYSTSLSIPATKKVPTPPISFYTTLTNGHSFLEASANGEVIFDFSKGRQWIGDFRQLWEEGKIYSPRDDEPSPLLRGKTLFESVGSWLVSQGRKHPETRLQVFPVPPRHSGGASRTRATVNGLGIVANGGATEEEQRRAWQLIQFLTTDEKSQKRMVDHLSFLPSNKAIFEKLRKLPEWRPYTEALETAVLRCDHPIQHGVTKVVRKYFFAAVTGEIDTDTAVERINEIVRLLIEIDRESHV